jgi:hypothetical protein
VILRSLLLGRAKVQQSWPHLIYFYFYITTRTATQ